MTGSRVGPPWASLRRTLLGGVVAGLVFNVGGMISAWLVGLPETFSRFGVEPTVGTALLHLALRFGLGLASVALYAGTRPGWGPGRRSAAQVGLLVWFAAYVPGSVVLHEVGVLSAGQLAFTLPWGLGEAIAATLLGGWIHDRL